MGITRSSTASDRCDVLAIPEIVWLPLYPLDSIVLTVVHARVLGSVRSLARPCSARVRRREKRRLCGISVEQVLMTNSRYSGLEDRAVGSPESLMF